MARTHSRRSDRLRIGVLCPPWFPVPPIRYGGIEAVVALLADGLADQGYDVTLFAAGGSRTRAHLVAIHREAPSAQLGQTLPELRQVLSCIQQAGNFDVISDHSGPLAVALSEAIETPFVHTVHNALDTLLAPAYDAALAFARDAEMISLSRHQRQARREYPWLANIPNAVDLVRYPCRRHAQGKYLLWVGRMCRDKGPDRAIEVARAAGLPILLAGKMHTTAERAYFARNVEPLLGAAVRYVGEADRATVVALLHDAVALVNPIDWPEPFGLVMIEALACGVPVLTTRRGAAPEIVVDGVTGFVADDYRSLSAAVPAATAIAPRTCRDDAEQRFAPALMVARYVSAFERAISRHGAIPIRTSKAAEETAAATPPALTA